MKISKDEWADIQKYASRNVQKGVQGDGQRNGHNVSHEDPSQQQHASNVICNHWIFRLGTINK